MEITILYVEDDEQQRNIAKKLLQKNNYNVIDVSNAIDGLETIKKNRVDIVISDFRMPNMNGDEFLREVKKINPYTFFILITAYGNVELAVDIMKNGAVDFLTKPFNFDVLLEKIKYITKEKMLDKELKKIKNGSPDDENCDYNGIIGKAKSFTEILAKIPKIAQTNMPILILGESGTGKELIADLIHNISERKDKPFTKINCAAIPEDLIESELFGYEKGAFSGAYNTKAGLIEAADKGNVFLDEIGELSYPIQSKLLRFIQNSEIRRIGSNQTKKVDVRIISATNRDLEKAIKEKKFREDLYFRLNVINIKLPPLKERKEDIPLLVDFFVKKYSKEAKSNDKIISRETMDKLIKYDYPGNIRELENIIRNSVALSMGDIIEPEDIPIFNTKDYHNSIDISEKPLDIGEYINNIEKQIITKALEKNKWNRQKTADYLNITERVLRYKISKFEIRKKKS